MKDRASTWCLIAVAVGLLSAAPADTVEDLVRHGNAAFERGDYAAAVDSYTSVEARVHDPGLVAFNKAAALYRLGQYREAEVYYLCCLEDATGERRVRVLYDLGNAIVQQAQDRDAKRLDQAISYYQECLRRGGAESELADDVRFNLRLAQALLVKAVKDQPNSDNPNSSDPHNPRDRAPETRPGGDASPGTLDAQGQERAAADRNGDSRHEPVSTNQPPPPGVGNLPLIPDQDELVPLSPQDTLAYLEQMKERVLRERKEHRKRAASTASHTEKDW